MSPRVRQWGFVLAYTLLLFFLSFYISMHVEETARQISHPKNPYLPRKIKRIIHLIGAGKLERPLSFCRLSKREQMRVEFSIDPDTAVIEALGFPCNVVPRVYAALRRAVSGGRIWQENHKKVLVSFGTPAPSAAPDAATGADSSLPLQTSSQQAVARGATEADLEAVLPPIPVVFIATSVGTDLSHPSIVAIRQARKVNDVVYVLVPNRVLCPHLQRLDVRVESLEAYNSTDHTVRVELGLTRVEQAQLFYLRAFMKRRRLDRVFLVAPYTLLFANVTELVHTHFPYTPLALPVRWPTLQPPPLPTQRDHLETPVSLHAGLWSFRAVDDVLRLFQNIMNLRLFGGRWDQTKIVHHRETFERAVVGWYVWSECWTNAQLDPPCMAEPVIGITGKLRNRMWKRSRFRPKFQVESLSQPRACANTSWSDEGLCVFDHRFSVATRTRFFKFRPPDDKCPHSKHYEHFNEWMGERAPAQSVQFLAVNFQNRLEYLTLEDPSPEKSWGSAPE